MVIISMADANDFVTSAILDTESYKFHFSWNDTGFWLMDLRDSEGRDIVRGIKLLPNFPLLNQYRRLAGMVKGEFVIGVVNEDDEKSQQIPRDGFTSGRFSLIYVSESDKNAILEASIQD